MNIALIVFAGKGVRMNSPIPKQFIKIHNKDLVVYTIEKFEKCDSIDEIILVTHKDYVDYVKDLVIKYDFSKVRHIVEGGETRQDSVRLGLERTSYSKEDKILIHDGDRPLVDSVIIKNNIDALDEYDAVSTFIYHKDALSVVSNLGRVKKLGDLDVDIQTPQSFRYGVIKKYHEMKKDIKVSDDISLLENDYDICYISGSPFNFKVTTDIDLEVIKGII